MATHCSTLAWQILWMEEPGRLQSMGSQSRTRLSDFTFTFHFHALEKKMATHSSVLAWRIPGMGEAWWAAIYGVAQSWTQLKRCSSSRGKTNYFYPCDRNFFFFFHIGARHPPKLGSYPPTETWREASQLAPLMFTFPKTGSQVVSILKKWFLVFKKLMKMKNQKAQQTKVPSSLQSDPS